MNTYIRTTVAFLLCSIGVACNSITNTTSGEASFYSDALQGRATASGEPYDKDKITAAHRTLEFGTRVRVTNVANSQSIIVEINDRGPFVDGRIIDLSRASFSRIADTDLGVVDVRIEVLD